MTRPVILSTGCRLPSGVSPNEVVLRVQESRPPVAATFACQDGGEVPVFLAEPPPEVLRHPRLRRSSRISHFACAAALDAVAGFPDWDPSKAALVFAASNGAVIYTRQFYDGVVRDGTGSPLFFPETVYNAPASHVAALLGIDGEVLTLVSDATAAVDALATAAEILESPAVETCLVVAAEEADSITASAYRAWGLVGEPVATRSRAILSEGAVALLLGRGPGTALTEIHAGESCGAGLSLRSALCNVLARVSGPLDLIVEGASGSRTDAIETALLDQFFPSIPRLAPNRILGQAFAVSALTQILIAAESLRPGQSALVPVAGWNGRAGGLVLTGGKPRA